VDVRRRGLGLVKVIASLRGELLRQTVGPQYWSVEDRCVSSLAPALSRKRRTDG